MIDIDHFKLINDRYGDDILKTLASILNESTRSSDMVARLGGEEFCIILPGAGTGQNNAVQAMLASLILNALLVHLSFRLDGCG
ncbi:MAG: GGDEF domain-containing protein [Mariprofundaceae bacterium]|nr:GGDEF domain-containing protein [Mariprofundaceae bacterium]